MPLRTSPSEPARRATRPRPRPPSTTHARWSTAIEPPWSGCRSRTSLRSVSSAGGWRSARPSSPGRPARTIQRAWEAIRPAVAARPAPFLEAYVAWRAAEAWAGRGDLTRGRRAAPRGLRDRGDDRCVGPRGRDRGPRSAPAHRSLDARRRGAGACGGWRSSEADYVGEPAAPADPFGLTTREREVLALVAEGYTNRRIAETLFISESTAGVHVSHILGKLGVETRTEAATIAVRLGLDQPAG